MAWKINENFYFSPPTAAPSFFFPHREKASRAFSNEKIKHHKIALESGCLRVDSQGDHKFCSIRKYDVIDFRARLFSICDLRTRLNLLPTLHHAADKKSHGSNLFLITFMLASVPRPRTARKMGSREVYWGEYAEGFTDETSCLLISVSKLQLSELNRSEARPLFARPKIFGEFPIRCLSCSWGMKKHVIMEFYLITTVFGARNFNKPLFHPHPSL